MRSRTVTIIPASMIGGATVMLGQLNTGLARQPIELLLCVRSLGIGLVMMPMLGGGVFVLPTRLIADGIVFRTIVQRTGAALGFAAVSVLVTVDRAQHFADRSALLDISAPYYVPGVYNLQRHGPGGLIPLWQALQVRTLTDAYAFTVLGVVTLTAALFSLLGRWPTPPRISRRELVEVGV